MFNKKTIHDINVENQNILVRTDFNVPLQDQKVQNNFRIQAALPTIQYLIDHHASHIILISHLGRPNGQINPALSLKPVSLELSKLLKRPVIFIPETIGKKVRSIIDSAPVGSIILLENLRFNPGEEANDPLFAKQIVEDTHANFFIQDGFAVIHRAHASTAQIPKFLPTVVGLLVEKEVKNLSKILESPIRPATLILGGAKIADKQPLIDRFLPIVDHILVIGKIAADGFRSDNSKIYVAEDFRKDQEGNKLDIGDQSLAKILPIIKESHTVIWNGTAGKTETLGFDVSSKIIAETIGKKDLNNNQTIILGGDTVSFVENLISGQDKNLNLDFSLLSTGGGASLEFLLGLPLPGLEAIRS